ncbi:MAG: hypothetical protein ACTTJ7_07695 [Treponema sp.]
MGTAMLIKFELDKLINIVSVIGSLLLLVGLCWSAFNAGQGSAARFIDDRGSIGSFEGNAGEVLTFKRKQKAQYKGPVTVEKLQDSYFTYKKLSENYGIDGEIAWRHEYSFAFSTLTGAFTPPGLYDTFIMDKIDETDIEQMYANRVDRLTESMQLPENQIHASPKVAELAQKITVPFYYDGDAPGWQIFNSLRTIAAVKYFMLLVIVCSSFSFLNEIVFSSCIHFSLATLHGRKVHAIAKIQALCIFTTILYLLIIGTYGALTFFRFGTHGGNNAMQIGNFYSLYTGTYAQFTRLYLLITYFTAIFFALLSFYISLHTKNIVSTVIIALLVLYSGSLVSEGSWPERFIFLFPYSAVHVSQLAWRPIVYNLFGQPVLFVYLYIPVCLVFSVIIAFLIVRKFKTMKI